MGFYYDDLIRNNRFTFRLLAREMKEDGTFEEDKYTVIARDFIRDSLSLNIAHEWGGLNSNISAKVGDFWTAMSKQYQSMKSSFASLSEFITKSDFKTFAFNQYVSISDHIKTFKGTEVSIPLNLTIKYFARNSDISVSQEVGNLLKYLVGGESLPVENDMKDLGEFGGYGSILAPWMRSAGTMREIKAPHGYDSVQANFTDVIQGSLHLHYGSSMAIDNLLLTNVNLTVSRETDIYGQPLYAEVVLSLTPARMFSVTELKTLFDVTSESGQRLYLRS